MSFFSATLLLVLVMDPLGNIPPFLALLKNLEPKRRQIVVARELAIALLILIVFLFFGQDLLQALQISEPSLTVAGGVILYLIAIRMIFPPASGIFGEQLDGEPFIFPLAIPLVAGPSAMVTVMLVMSREPQRWPEWLSALFIAWGLTSLVLFFSGRLSQLLGRRGLLAMERLMGMLLVTIATEMLMSGIGTYITGLQF